MGLNIFYRFFAGIPMGETDTFPLIPLGCWFFPIGIYLLMIGSYLGMDRKNRHFVMIRYGRIQKWWKNYFVKNMLYGGLATVALLFLGEMIELLVSKHLSGDLKEVFGIFVLWTVHGMMFLALFLILETTNVRKMVPSILLLLEGMTFLYGYRNKMTARFMFGTWGMYVQSDFYDHTYGFPIVCVIAVQVLCIAGCYLLGNYMLKRKEVEGA